MNWEQVEGKWKQYAGKVHEKWGKLTDSDLEMIHGKREQLIGKIQERYGIAKEEAQHQVDEYFNQLNTSMNAAQGQSAQGEKDEQRHDKARGAGKT